MPPVHPFPGLDFEDALDGSACLGAWTHDVAADRFGLARPLGDALGLTARESAGVPLARLIAAIHPEHSLRIESLFLAARDTGGPFEAEFRTRGGARWLRLMGRTDLGGSDGAVRTCGLAFDLTEGRLGRGGPGRGAQWQANQLAEHVIAMKGLVPPLDNPSLAHLVDRLAVEIGFELARRFGEAAGDVRH
ncbi:PAS domain-containing protein [Methylobacterium gnaphalii]|uniref:PAS fold-3 domain-containing protein n=1 Tax=Methylobacterium gnaphalii TaxID=1010610 RepID=A0A512JHT6_9HYPH|nr:PAS domain-containing protein [Methylobacterium gnaphalii]GEP09483.1 hypothetical protein MGN01_13280 [Methylobacterium gnaphalii]GJD68038.1 hypothetical protein MMMDOFMJ_0956 [Methylobacterium gnaphalii]GLS51742.1 hypothetical protein GCM10007885_46030 [Methylobacterium gnaphalii]